MNLSIAFFEDIGCVVPDVDAPLYEWRDYHHQMGEIYAAASEFSKLLELRKHKNVPSMVVTRLRMEVDPNCWVDRLQVMYPAMGEVVYSLMEEGIRTGISMFAEVIILENLPVNVPFTINASTTLEDCMRVIFA